MEEIIPIKGLRIEGELGIISKCIICGKETGTPKGWLDFYVKIGFDDFSATACPKHIKEVRKKVIQFIKGV